MRRTGQRGCSRPADGDEPEPDSNHTLATKVMRALDSGFPLSPGKEPSAPPTDLAIRAFRSGRPIGRATDIRKVFRLSTRTAFNSSGQGDLAAMAVDDEPNGPADTAEPSAKIILCARGAPCVWRNERT